MESKRIVFQETNVVSGTMKISVQNRNQKPHHCLNHQHKEVKVNRGERTSVAGVHLGSSVQRLLERYLHQITMLRPWKTLVVGRLVDVATYRPTL